MTQYVPIYDLFLDLPHPEASSNCDRAKLIGPHPNAAESEAALLSSTASAAPSSSSSVVEELYEGDNVAKITKYAFPDHDDLFINANWSFKNAMDAGRTSSSLGSRTATSKTTAASPFHSVSDYMMGRSTRNSNDTPGGGGGFASYGAKHHQQQTSFVSGDGGGGGANLNRHDVYLQSFPRSDYHSFILRLSSGIRMHGHARRYLPPHKNAGGRADVGRRGVRAMVILTRSLGGEKFWSSVLKTMECVMIKQAAMHSSSASLVSSCNGFPTEKEEEEDLTPPLERLLHELHEQHERVFQLWQHQQQLRHQQGNVPAAEDPRNSTILVPGVEFGTFEYSPPPDTGKGGVETDAEDPPPLPPVMVHYHKDYVKFHLPPSLQPSNCSSSSSSSTPLPSTSSIQRIEESDSPILPLLRCLGASHFLRLLSALLCERRIIIISQDITRLSVCVRGAAAMLAQGLLIWQHVYIPVLPPHLLKYLATPSPYLVGLLEPYMRNLEMIPGMGDVLCIDLDSNAIWTYHVPDPSRSFPDLLSGSSSAFGSSSDGGNNNNIFSSSSNNNLSLGLSGMGAADALAYNLTRILKSDNKLWDVGSSSTTAAGAAASTTTATALMEQQQQQQQRLQEATATTMNVSSSTLMSGGSTSTNSTSSSRLFGGGGGGGIGSRLGLGLGRGGVEESGSSPGDGGFFDVGGGDEKRPSWRVFGKRCGKGGKRSFDRGVVVTGGEAAERRSDFGDCGGDGNRGRKQEEGGGGGLYGAYSWSQSGMEYAAESAATGAHDSDLMMDVDLNGQQQGGYGGNDRNLSTNERYPGRRCDPNTPEQRQQQDHYMNGCSSGSGQISSSPSSDISNSSFAFHRIENENGEELLRNALVSFYLVLYGDMGMYLSESDDGSGTLVLDRKKFLLLKKIQGDEENTPMFLVLAALTKSDMFTNFVKNRIDELDHPDSSYSSSSTSSSSSPSSNMKYVPLFSQCERHLLMKEMNATVQNVPQVVRAISESSSLSLSSRYLSEKARSKALHLTSKNVVWGDALLHDLVTLSEECHDVTSVLPHVLGVLWTRLNVTNRTRSSSSNNNNDIFEGSIDRSGKSISSFKSISSSVVGDSGPNSRCILLALHLLRTLLLHGPITVIPEAMDNLDIVHYLMSYTSEKKKKKTIKGRFGGGGGGRGEGGDVGGDNNCSSMSLLLELDEEIQELSACIYDLILDRATLFTQRRYCAGKKMQMTMTTFRSNDWGHYLLSKLPWYKKGQKFHIIHDILRPPPSPEANTSNRTITTADSLVANAGAQIDTEDRCDDEKEKDKNKRMEEKDPLSSDFNNGMGGSGGDKDDDHDVGGGTRMENDHDDDDEGDMEYENSLPGDLAGMLASFNSTLANMDNGNYDEEEEGDNDDVSNRNTTSMAHLNFNDNDVGSGYFTGEEGEEDEEHDDSDSKTRHHTQISSSSASPVYKSRDKAKNHYLHNGDDYRHENKEEEYDEFGNDNNEDSKTTTTTTTAATSSSLNTGRVPPKQAFQF